MGPGVLWAVEPASHWFSQRCPFTRCRASNSSSRRPSPLQAVVHPPSPRVLFRVPSLVLPLLPLEGALPAPSLSPSSRRHWQRPQLARRRSLALFRPRAFSASRRFSPPPVLRAYRIPLPRPGFLRSGASLDPQPHRLVAGRCPLAVVVRPLTGEPAAMIGRLGFEAFLRGSKRSPGSGVGLPSSRSPLRFLPPSGSGSPSWSRFPGSSARDLPTSPSLGPKPECWPRRLSSASRRWVR